MSTFLYTFGALWAFSMLLTFAAILGEEKSGKWEKFFIWLLSPIALAFLLDEIHYGALRELPVCKYRKDKE